jgi:uncharacterized protein involved in tolerance to divalent cations
MCNWLDLKTGKLTHTNPYTGVGPIANDAAYAAIVETVNECRNKYFWNKKIEDYQEDYDYIDNVLAKFAETRNVCELIQAIAEQDTYPREFYAYIVNDLESDYYNGEWE